MDFSGATDERAFDFNCSSTSETREATKTAFVSFEEETVCFITSTATSSES